MIVYSGIMCKEQLLMSRIILIIRFLSKPLYGPLEERGEIWGRLIKKIRYANSANSAWYMHSRQRYFIYNVAFFRWPVV